MSCPSPFDFPPIFARIGRVKCTQLFVFEDDPGTAEDESGSLEQITYSSFDERMGPDSYDTRQALDVGSTWANGGGQIDIEQLGPFIPIMLGWRIVTSSGGVVSYSYDSQVLFDTPVSFAEDPLGTVDDYSYKDDFGIWRLV